MSDKHVQVPRFVLVVTPGSAPITAKTFEHDLDGRRHRYLQSPPWSHTGQVYWVHAADGGTYGGIRPTV